MVDFILKFLGIPFMQPLTFWFLLGLAFAVSVASGWIADAITGSQSFGIAMNALLLFIGALITFVGWQYLRLPFSGQYVYFFIVAIGFFPACQLLLCIYLKRFF